MGKSCLFHRDKEFKGAARGTISRWVNNFLRNLLLSPYSWRSPIKEGLHSQHVYDRASQMCCGLSKEEKKKHVQTLGKISLELLEFLKLKAKGLIKLQV